MGFSKAPEEPPDALVYRAVIDGVVSPVMAEFLVEAITKAEEADADLLVIEIDTPGGLDPSMREIIQAILASEVPVAVYVAPKGGRAASAGCFIAMAAHIAAMAPNTSIGAAHPVSTGGEMDETMSKKVTNDAVSYIRSLAAERGRNVEWAERAVRKSASLNEDDALEEGVIEYVAADVEHLIAQCNGTTLDINGIKTTLKLDDYAIETLKPGIRQQFLAVITNPNIAYLLMIIGFYGLVYELAHPGAIFPGVVGAICILLGLYGLATLPVNYAGVGLLLLALILFILEVKITSYGMLTVGGVIAMVLGSALLIKSPAPFLRVSWAVIIPAVLSTVTFFAFLAYLVVRTHKRKPTTGDAGMIGKLGKATTPVGPEGGQVFVNGEHWRATSDEDIALGEAIEVVATEGLELTVKKAEKSA
ncbi:MAG: nodulation protein NfeD [bacterium]|nr:nodulation protein NfeD [bacterium]